MDAEPGQLSAAEFGHPRWPDHRDPRTQLRRLLFVVHGHCAHHRRHALGFDRQDPRRVRKRWRCSRSCRRRRHDRAHRGRPSRAFFAARELRRRSSPACRSSSSSASWTTSSSRARTTWTPGWPRGGGGEKKKKKKKKKKKPKRSAGANPARPARGGAPALREAWVAPPVGAGRARTMGPHDRLRRPRPLRPPHAAPDAGRAGRGRIPAHRRPDPAQFVRERDRRAGGARRRGSASGRAGFYRPKHWNGAFRSSARRANPRARLEAEGPCPLAAPLGAGASPYANPGAGPARASPPPLGHWQPRGRARTTMTARRPPVYRFDVPPRRARAARRNSRARLPTLTLARPPAGAAGSPSAPASWFEHRLPARMRHPYAPQELVRRVEQSDLLTRGAIGHPVNVVTKAMSWTPPRRPPAEAAGAAAPITPARRL